MPVCHALKSPVEAYSGKQHAEDRFESGSYSVRPAEMRKAIADLDPIT
jgi:hypothetical protein